MMKFLCGSYYIVCKYCLQLPVERGGDKRHGCFRFFLTCSSLCTLLLCLIYIRLLHGWLQESQELLKKKKIHWSNSAVLFRIHSRVMAGFSLSLTLIIAWLSPITWNAASVLPLSAVSCSFMTAFLLILSQNNWKIFGKHIKRRRRKKKERHMRL